jgi:flagellar biogenesis protein FliO
LSVAAGDLLAGLATLILFPLLVTLTVLLFSALLLIVAGAWVWSRLPRSR